MFVSPYEHHSNLLPWREIGSRVIRIPETPDGQVDLNYLENQLMVGLQMNKSLTQHTGTTIFGVWLSFSYFQHSMKSLFYTILGMENHWPEVGWMFHCSIQRHRHVSGCGCHNSISTQTWSPGVMGLRNRRSIC